MLVAFAFLAGVAVTVAAMFVPHARNPHSSIEDFESFQNILRTLPVVESNKRQHTL